MPSKGKKFISEFLIPNLEGKKFGSRLKWLNIKEAKFQLQWNHKSSADWKEKDAEVFIEWDKIKGHYRPEEKEYYTKSKQRFRAVLYKLIREQQIIELGSKDKNTKIYCFGMREKCEDINCFELHSSPSYSVENQIEYINEDHNYSLSELSVSENEDDMSLYSVQSSCYTYSKDASQKLQSHSVINEKTLAQHNYQQPLLNDKSTIYVDLIRSDVNFKSESMEDFCSHISIDENITATSEDAFHRSTQVSNYSDLDFSNYNLQRFQEIIPERRYHFDVMKQEE